MRTLHGTAYGLALEAALNAQDCLNEIDLEFFLCAVIDGEKVAIECGGNINDNIIRGLEDFLNKLKINNGHTAIYSYRNQPAAVLKEVESGLI